MSFFFPQIVQIDSGEKKRKGGQFKVGKKKVKTKLSALAKAKAAQAMEVDKWVQGINIISLSVEPMLELWTKRQKFYAHMSFWWDQMGTV